MSGEKDDDPKTNLVQVLGESADLLLQRAPWEVKRAREVHGVVATPIDRREEDAPVQVCADRSEQRLRFQAIKPEGQVK